MDTIRKHLSYFSLFPFLNTKVLPPLLLYYIKLQLFTKSESNQYDYLIDSTVEHISLYGFFVASLLELLSAYTNFPFVKLICSCRTAHVNNSLYNYIACSTS